MMSKDNEYIVNKTIELFFSCFPSFIKNPK